MAMRARLVALGVKAVHVGVLKGEMHVKDGKSVPMATLAVAHEFGAPEKHIPERSVFRAGMNRGTPEISRVAGEALRGVLRGETSTDEALNAVGLVAEGEVKREFVVGDLAPLDPKTIARKGSDRPLIDTFQFLNAVTHQVERR
jgi:hypothetical protein